MSPEPGIWARSCVPFSNWVLGPRPGSWVSFALLSWQLDKWTRQQPR